jgi:SAM-dependent methyltransferase
MHRLLKRLNFLRAMGWRFFFYNVRKRFFRPRIRFESHLQSFRGRGLEVGGPSATFSAQGLFPVYEVAQCIDNVNFSNCTRWEGALKSGKHFVFDHNKEPGSQFVLEGLDLSAFPDASYDFILSCHMLEHTANPLRALKEWKRVLKDGGSLLLVLPHKNGSFDHRRPVTSLDHLLADFRNNVGEDDRTHLKEILELHDLRRDPEQASAADFEKWISENETTRGAHQHVFDTRAVVRMLTQAGFDVVDVEAAMPYHIFSLATKRSGDNPVNVESTINAHVKSYRKSPFSSDNTRSQFKHKQSTDVVGQLF